MANSPKARQLEKLAAETRARAEAVKAERSVDDDDPVVRYVLNNAEYYERRAREAQERADRRAVRKARASR